MKLPLSRANEQLRNFVEARIKEKAEEVCYCEFNLDHCTGVQSQTIELNGFHNNGKYEIEWGQMLTLISKHHTIVVITTNLHALMLKNASLLISK